MVKKSKIDELPHTVATLTKEVRDLKELLLRLTENKSALASEKLLTINEAADFLDLKVPTIYSKVSKGELPVMKRGKRLYFSRTELLEYLKAGRKSTNAEIMARAEEYLLKRKGGSHV